jgi:hypothetical protein
MHLLLGFDIHAPLSSPPDPAWGGTRREQYLLRPEIAVPLSVDRMVWPSLLTNRDAPFGLLLTLDELDRHSTRLVESGVDHPTLVCISGFADSPLPEAWGIASPLPNIAGTDLGFDIADASLLSGLSNCGLTPPEQRKMRAAWTRNVNHYGLVNDLESASLIRKEYDELVQEHSPFYVYLIRQVNQGTFLPGA